MKRPIYKKLLLKGIGIAILILLLLRLNFGQIVQDIREINLNYFVVGLALFIPMLFFKSLRWAYILRKQKINITRIESLIFYASGMFVGSVTPGRIGEMIKVFYIRNKGYLTGSAFFSVIIDRLADIGLLAGVGYVGMIFFVGLFTKQIKILSIFFLIVTIIGLIFVVTGGRLKKLIETMLNVLLVKKKGGVIDLNVRAFMASFDSLNFRGFTYIILVTLVSWVFYYLEMYFFAQALGLDLSFLYVIAIVSVVALVALVPISIAGIGTRDAALVLLFSEIGLPEESAIAFSSLILLMMVVNVGICSIGWFLNTERRVEEASTVAE